MQTPYNQARQLDGVQGLQIEKSPPLSWQHLDFNVKARHSLQDVAVRRAIAHAINKQTLARAQGGFPTPIKSVVVPVFDFYDPATPDYAFDRALADRLLDAAGYARGADGTRAKDGERLAYRFVVQAGRGDAELAQQAIMAQLRAVGIQATPDNKTGVARCRGRWPTRATRRPAAPSRRAAAWRWPPAMRRFPSSRASRHGIARAASAGRRHDRAVAASHRSARAFPVGSRAAPG